MQLAWLARSVAMALMMASRFAIALPVPEDATSNCTSEQGEELQCKSTYKDVARQAYPSF